MPYTIEQLLAHAQAAGIDLRALAAEVNRQAFPGVKKTTFKRLNVERGMYKQAAKEGVSLTEILEREDPSENYPGVGLDAFERQLAARGLSVAGRAAVKLEEFYDTPDSSVLFPEFIDRQVRMGELLSDVTLRDDDIIATETEIDSMTYENAIVDLTSDVNMKIVPQGTKFPRVSITLSDKTVTLRKHAILISQTYEHLRGIRVNKMAVFLRLVGWKMAQDKAADALDILMNGNTGQSNPAFTFAATGLTYNNMVDFFLKFDPYSFRVVILPEAGLGAVLKLSEFKDSRIFSEFLTEGRLISPMGATMKRHDPETASVLASKMVGVDERFALERIVQSGATLTETDKVIDGQWEELAISTVVGYAKIIADAAGVWDYS